MRRWAPTGRGELLGRAGNKALPVHHEQGPGRRPIRGPGKDRKGGEVNMIEFDETQSVDDPAREAEVSEDAEEAEGAEAADDE